ncbi:MAG: UDP-N-acetylglucosamine--N-acetylmuramyl-(pentapeptide) pyrophosphoryl-undecaprenol N-acetylglucosamine transferase [Candidatus Eremiobacteraeota bacterium]|nr:UDP-N-acetylglucosamine--N-acetylmuramyl-(pentapeptide) pyrophosphoryl-undecaprenol N-acetylglucosamine transferase [Candidatus Eremiobacteraeota bacterium]
MNVVFAAGGTGGHLYPALALAAALKNFAANAGVPLRISFLGNADRLEATLVPQAGYRLSCIAGHPLDRKLSVKTLRTVLTNAYGVVLALAALRRAQPSLIIATGGYVCFPVVVAARLLAAGRMSCARIALLEINAYPGLTNRLLAPLVDEVWGGYAGAASFFGAKYHRTGIPVRRELSCRSRAEAAVTLGIDPRRATILAIGGSQGARSINQAVVELVTRRRLPADWQVLHVTGERDYHWVKAQGVTAVEGNVMKVLPYAHDVAAAYAVADIVVARAGASTLAELAFTGKPSILVPFPFAAENHQMANARVFAQAGAARILEDGALSGDAIWRLLCECMEPGNLTAMSAGARSLAAGDAIDEILRRIRVLLKW